MMDKESLAMDIASIGNPGVRQSISEYIDALAASKAEQARIYAVEYDAKQREVEALAARGMSFHKVDRGYGWRVLMAIHNTEISVGKACELLREYMATGVEGQLPDADGTKHGT